MPFFRGSKHLLRRYLEDFGRLGNLKETNLWRYTHFPPGLDCGRKSIALWDQRRNRWLEDPPTFYGIETRKDWDFPASYVSLPEGRRRFFSSEDPKEHLLPCGSMVAVDQHMASISARLKVEHRHWHVTEGPSKLQLSILLLPCGD